MLQNQLDSMVCSTFIWNYTELQIFYSIIVLQSDLRWGKPITEYM